jgi:hypothetical protein
MLRVFLILGVAWALVMCAGVPHETPALLADDSADQTGAVLRDLSPTPRQPAVQAAAQTPPFVLETPPWDRPEHAIRGAAAQGPEQDEALFRRLQARYRMPVVTPPLIDHAMAFVPDANVAYTMPVFVPEESGDLLQEVPPRLDALGVPVHPDGAEDAQPESDAPEE